MTLVLQAFWQILLVRGSPQILPYSRLLLGSVLLLHLLVGMALAAFTLPLEEALLSAAVGTVLIVAISQGLLALYGVGQRTVQVVTALAGCEFAIGLMALPLNGWFYAVERADAGIPALLSMVLLGWNVALVAHIYRHALGVSKGLGFLFAIGYVIISLTLASLIVAPEG